MRFVVLGSGSKGNALIVEGGGVTLLVDCGFTPKALRARMQMVGLELNQIDALLVTHGHGDHTKGAGRLAGPMRLRTYATLPTTKYLARAGGLSNFVEITPGEPFFVGGLEVMPFATPHDAPGSVGFVIREGEDAVGICTDLGHPAPEVGRALHGCSLLYIELNHDLDMLRLGPYPPVLKRRVASDRGHLSNEQGAELLRMASSDALQVVLLAHLSETNNTPALALAAAARVVDEDQIVLEVAPQHEPSRWFAVGAAFGDPQRPSKAAALSSSEPAGGRDGARGRAPRRVLPEEESRVVDGAVEAMEPVTLRSVGRPAGQGSIAVQRQLQLFGGPAPGGTARPAKSSTTRHVGGDT